jgi:UDP-N-acetylglucosamine 1-carboxyvinyltransferase
VPGSKNAALAILSAVILCEGQVVLHNVPQIADVHVKLDLLERYGVKVEWHEESLYLDCSEVSHFEPEEALARPIRTSFYLLGPLLTRVGRANLPMPGGCQIGARPVDFHIKGLGLLGADIELSNGRYVSTNNGLRGAAIYFDFPSPGATQHIMATATRVPGETVIHNAAMEPEVVALSQFLNRMGARVEGAGTSTITVSGVDKLSGGEFRIPADRLQAGTYLLAGAITQGSVTVNQILPENQAAVTNKLRECGVLVEQGSDWIKVDGSAPKRGLRVKTMPYPGFPTDMQQPMAALLTLVEGNSFVEETIYESRIGHIQELNRMGASVRAEGRTTVISGVSRLKGAVVEATDLRAGAALVLAALAAEGTTVLKNLHYVDRGYENFEIHLRSLGASVERIDSKQWNPASGGRSN